MHEIKIYVYCNVRKQPREPRLQVQLSQEVTILCSGLCPPCDQLLSLVAPLTEATVQAPTTPAQNKPFRKQSICPGLSMRERKSTYTNASG